MQNIRVHTTFKLYIFIIGTVLLFLVIFAPAVSSQAFEQRTALVIGNQAYKQAQLTNPVNDAEDMAAILETSGFNVSKIINADRRTMREAIRDFGNKIKRGGIGLFYYAGHGIQVDGENYLVPIKAEVFSEEEVEDEALKVSSVLRKMEVAANGMNIIILDACRDNPFGRSYRSSKGGLAKMDAPTGSIIAYATAPGSIAADGQTRNGLYTSKLLKHITSPGLEIEKIFKRVRVDVAQASGYRQIPWESSSLMGSFYFFKKRGLTILPKHASQKPATDPPAVLEPDRERLELQRQELVAYKSKLEEQARTEVVRLKKQEEQAKIEVKRLQNEKETLLAMFKRQKKVSKKKSVAGPPPITNAIGMKFTYISPGSFMMGSAPGETGRDADEQQHRVTLTKAFYMQTTEVTQEQWTAVMRNFPSDFDDCGDDCPVEMVSWSDVQAFIRKLNQIEGRQRYRLPTEAEWEYASRSGSKTALANGKISQLECRHDANLAAMGWYCGNAKGRPHPVARKKPNQWGLYDMHGNINEWCQDNLGEYPSTAVNDPAGPSTGNYRVYRGGSWFSSAGYSRSAVRYCNRPDYRSNHLGFRVVMNP
jgi:formylglycine-generating enzyme required for sulfatase activity